MARPRLSTKVTEASLLKDAVDEIGKSQTLFWCQVDQELNESTWTWRCDASPDLKVLYFSWWNKTLQNPYSPK